MNDQAEQNITEIIQNKKIKRLVYESLLEVKLNRKSIWQYGIGFAFSFALSSYISLSYQIVDVIQKMVEFLNGIDISFLAMVLGSYAIFQALLTNNVIKLLIESEANLLNESNRSFLHLTVLYLISILINFFVYIITLIMPDDFTLFNNTKTSEICAFILIFIYLFYNILIITEIKNFVVNLYQMFNVYNVVRACEVENETDDDSDE